MINIRKYITENQRGLEDASNEATRETGDQERRITVGKLQTKEVKRVRRSAGPKRGTRLRAPLNLVLWAGLAFLLVSGASVAQDAQAAAEAGLAKLSAFANEDTYAEMGFESAKEVSRARLGSPISMMMVRLDELQAYDPEGDPKALMHDTKEKLFPVFVGGAARTAIVVRPDDSGKWQMVSVGDAQTVKVVDSVRATHGQGRDFFLLSIPAIYQKFLGFTDGQGKIHLITMYEHDKLGIRRGEARPVRTVMELVKALAVEFQSPLGEPDKG